MDSSREARLELRNDLAELSRARAAVRDFIADAVEPRDLNRIVLALDEAIANIMEHAYPEDPDRVIQLAMHRTPERLVFTLEDDGEFFDPTTVPPPDLKEHVAESRDGGLGIYLYTTILEASHEARRGGGNRLRLERKLHREDA